MVLLGFAWFIFTLDAANSRLVYTIALVIGGLWGGVFLHLGLTFPSGRLTSALDRALTIAGYLIFPLAFVPALLFAGPHELGCDDCPTNLLLIRRDSDLAAVATAFGALLYLALFIVVLMRSIERWRGTGAAPDHPGLHLRVADLPARDGGPGRRRRGGLVGGLRLHRTDAVRLPGRPAAQPRLASRRGAAGADGGAAGVARAARESR
jgi:hypothetical protein